MEVDMGTPIVAAVSEAGENCWGFHQFPNMTRLPDGAILLTWADAADASETHGCPAPTLCSRDQGRTWSAFDGEPRPTRPHFCISAVLPFGTEQQDVRGPLPRHGAARHTRWVSRFLLDLTPICVIQLL